MGEHSVWPAVGLTLVLLLSLVNTGYIYSVASQNNNVPSADEIASKVKLPSYSPYNDTNLVNKVNKISDEVLKTDLKEAKAQELVSNELSSRDFKKAVQEFLNDELNKSGSSSEVDNYKDIKSVIISDGYNDFKVNGDDATVKLTLKVKYFLDGDTDVSDLESAKVKVDLSVSKLDADKLYVDAEVDSYSNEDFTLVKFYKK